MAPQPLKEEYLLTGDLESTNEWYAIAKITGVKACQSIRKQFGKDYVSLMPTNLYGTDDNFDLNNLLLGDPTKSKKLGWKPQYDLAGLVKEMVASDLEILKRV